MNTLKKAIIIKVGVIVVCFVSLLVIILAIVAAITGASFVASEAITQANSMSGEGFVVNNQIYTDKYKSILNEYLVENGYVSLERLVFYLQRTNNVLDVTTLSNEEWISAYFANLNIEKKQMIPIKTICISLNEDEDLSEYTIESNFNDDDIYIEALDLCEVNGFDVLTSDYFTESYSYQPYTLPLLSDFVITSIVFEIRDIDLELDEETQEATNFHEGWDFAVPIGTEFYSMCSGTITKIITTQYNDLSYDESGNSTGNYVKVTCDIGTTISYMHIQANSIPYGLVEGSTISQGDLLGKTSTTGLSTGPHLHVDIVNSSGVYLDILEYVNFN